MRQSDPLGRLRKHGVVCFAPAKINLALHVTGQLPDGYHAIDTVVAFADIGDRLFARLANPDEGHDLLSVTGRFAPHMPSAGKNLISTSITGLRSAAGACQLPAMEMRLEKNLPIASGLGGGSADAAAAIRAACILCDIPGHVDLERLGLSIGADIPMCLRSVMGRATGKGEKIVPLECDGPLPAVLLNPGISVATAEIFSRLTEKNNPPIRAGMDRPLTVEMLATLRNDLQPTAIADKPQIAGAIELLSRQPGCKFARMSGSGATCFAIFGKMSEAEDTASRISGLMPHAWCVATLLGSPEIAPKALNKGDWSDDTRQ